MNLTKIAARTVAAVAISIAALGLGTTTARADTPPPADPIAILGSLAYEQLFAHGIAVYEIASVDTFAHMVGTWDNTYPHGLDYRYLRFERVSSPSAGKPWTTKYAILGGQLPSTFFVQEGGLPIMEGDILVDPYDGGKFGWQFHSTGRTLINTGPAFIPGLGNIGVAIAP